MYCPVLAWYASAPVTGEPDPGAGAVAPVPQLYGATVGDPANIEVPRFPPSENFSTTGSPGLTPVFTAGGARSPTKPVNGHRTTIVAVLLGAASYAVLPANYPHPTRMVEEFLCPACQVARAEWSRTNTPPELTPLDNPRS